MRQRFGIQPGLARISALLQLLDNPEQNFRCVLVGGTNGKGSTASTLASILNASGHCTALFTSPHLTHFAERFVIDGEQVSEELLRDCLAEVKPVAETVGATFFEVVTALGCLIFSRMKIDVAVMEVGMGGRNDATNALNPQISIVTGVALDHTEILGETVGEIALEKAGILRAEKPALTAARGEAMDVLDRVAHQLGTTLWALDREISLSMQDFGWNGITVDVSSPLGSVAVHTPLIGLHQARNVALAVSAAQVFGLANHAIQRGVAATRWPGRLEVLKFHDRTFLLDGAHNPDAAEMLSKALESLNATPVTLIFGVATDKDIKGTIDALEVSAKQVILTRSQLSPRAAVPKAIASLWHIPSVITEEPKEAIDAALKRTSPGEVVVVAGSLYLIGELRPFLVGEVGEEWPRWQ